MSDIIVDKISKSFFINNKEIIIFSDVSIELNYGEFTSIIGESGCGKSTLMNILGGLDDDYQGDIYIEKVKLTKKEINNYRKNKVGFIFQNFNLIPHLSALQNIEMAYEVCGLLRANKRHKSIELLKKVGLEEHINKLPNQLSGGQRQRVAIARALVNDPDIILADEPTGSLDKDNSIEVLEILKSLSKQNKLVIIVTHSNHVSSLTTRRIKVLDGDLIDDKKNINDKIASKANLKKVKRMNLVPIIFKNIINKKIRNCLLSFGGSVGIVGILLILSLSNGVKSYINNEIKSFVNPQSLYVSKNLHETDTLHEKFFFNDSFTQNDIDYLYNVEGIKNIKSINEMYGSVNFEEKIISDLTLKMINPYKYDLIFIDGTFPKNGEVVITKAMQEELIEEMDVIIGSYIKVDLELMVNGQTLFSEVILKISGVIKDQQLLGVKYNIGHINEVSFMNIYKSIGISPQIKVLEVELHDEVDRVLFIEKLSSNYQVEDVSELLDKIHEYLNILTFILALFAIISLLVSSIMISIVMYINVVERTKEIGIIRALGASAYNILEIFCIESIIIGFLSGVIGLFSYNILSIGLNYATLSLTSYKLFIVKYEHILFVILLSVIINFSSSFAPSFKASKLSPVAALKYE